MSAIWGTAEVLRGTAEQPLLAEAVEKVRVINFCATIDRVSRACGNIDSMKCRILNHCFKNFDLRDFFNTLSQQWKFEAPTY
jgi:hypothetical protein